MVGTSGILPEIYLRTNWRKLLNAKELQELAQAAAAAKRAEREKDIQKYYEEYKAEAQSNARSGQFYVIVSHVLHQEIVKLFENDGFLVDSGLNRSRVRWNFNGEAVPVWDNEADKYITRKIQPAPWIQPYQYPKDTNPWA